MISKADIVCFVTLLLSPIGTCYVVMRQCTKLRSEKIREIGWGWSSEVKLTY